MDLQWIAHVGGGVIDRWCDEDSLVDEVLASAGPAGLENVHTLGLQDIVENGMPIACRAHVDDGSLVIDALFVVEDLAGLRSLGLLSGHTYLTHGVPDVSFAGGSLLVASRLQDDLLLCDDDGPIGLSLTFNRALGALAVRDGGALDARWHRWSAPTPTPATHQPCAGCDEFLPVSFPYSGRRHPQKHVEGIGLGAPEGGACVDEGLAPAIASLWRAGIATTNSCQGDGDRGYADGYLAIGSANIEMLLRRWNPISMRPPGDGSLWWHYAPLDLVLVWDDDCLRFDGARHTDIVRLIQAALVD